MVDTSAVGNAGALWAREDGADSDLLLREADDAMFEGKRSAVGVWRSTTR